MPRKGVSRRRVRRVPRGIRNVLDQGKVYTMEFRMTGTVNIAATAGTTLITEYNLLRTNMADRMGAVSDTFLYWRLVGMRVEAALFGGTTTDGATVGASQYPGNYQYGVAFVPISDVDTNTPAATGFSEIMDFPNFQMKPGNFPLTLNVSRRDCRTLSPWLTTSSTPDGVVQSAGTLTFVTISATISDASSIGQVRWVASFRCQFRSPSDINVTPTLLAKRVSRAPKPSRVIEVPPKGKDEEKTVLVSP